MHVVVVGGGVIGLLTAVESALAGHRVTVVDRGELPNPASTSADRHRIIRALHSGDPATTVAAARAHHRWLELERLLYARFYVRVGALSVLGLDRLDEAVSTLHAADATAEVLASHHLAERYPQVTFPGEVAALFEQNAGVLLADRALSACVGWLRWHPEVEILTRREVLSVDGATATVQLAVGGELTANALVVAAGPWSRALLPAATAERLTLFRQSMLYCRAGSREAAWTDLPAMPALGTPHGCWLIPPTADTPLKLTANSACRVVDAVTGRDTDDRWRQHLLDVFASLIPNLRSSWITAARDCYYLADAATGGPLLTVLGDAAVAYAACGGVSFKFAPLIARSLVRRVTGAAPEPTGLVTLDTPSSPEPVCAPCAPEGDRS